MNWKGKFSWSRALNWSFCFRISIAVTFSNQVLISLISGSNQFNFYEREEFKKNLCWEYLKNPFRAAFASRDSTRHPAATGIFSAFQLCYKCFFRKIYMFYASYCNLNTASQIKISFFIQRKLFFGPKEAFSSNFTILSKFYSKPVVNQWPKIFKLEIVQLCQIVQMASNVIAQAGFSLSQQKRKIRPIVELVYTHRLKVARGKSNIFLFNEGKALGGARISKQVFYLAE